ncbi:TonB-dependent receptor [Aquimarina algiphila]|uniref:TonB-dependent receptor n=2 Tax=Aquimarina algiphila TaxID=2047982 RepID=UPI0024923412|nr:TonB-dependent receptor [Aquimarina algiphila]
MSIILSRKLLCPLIILISYIMEAQQISGVILSETGYPIETATIQVFPSGNATISDKQGRFNIPIAEKDSISFLEVNHLAYLKKQIPLSIQQNLDSIEIRMKAIVTDLAEVTLVQKSILQEVINNSQSVVILDKDFISSNNTGTFSGALAALPGLNTMNVGVGIAKPMIRGMGFNRVLVNNRGIKQEGQQWGADHGLEVDPFDVDNVEIIKGPASLLFGSDGLGGVINIKDDRVPEKDGHFLEYLGMYQSNNGAISNTIDWEGKKGNWSYGNRITHQDYGDYTVPADDFSYAGFDLPIFENRLKNTAGNEFHFSGNLNYRSKTFSSTLRISSFNQKAGIFTGAIGLPRAYNLRHNGDFRNIDVPRQENQHHMITNNTTIAIGSDQLEIDLGYQRNIREELSFPGAHGISPELVGSNLALGLYLDTYTANLRYEINANDDRQILFGSQLQYMNNQKDGFEFLLPVFNSFQVGFFHYQLWELKTKWKINAGLRYDIGLHHIDQHLQPIYDRGTLMPTGEFEERTPDFNREFHNISGAFGATFKRNRKNIFKLHLGNSFRFPTAIELSSNGVHHGNFRHERGDSNLGIERGYQGDLTYLFQSSDLFLEASAFYGYFTDYIYLAPTGNFSPLASGGTLWQYRQDDAIFNGFEFSAQYNIAMGLQVDMAADFVQNLNLNSRLPLPLTPSSSITLGLDYSFLQNQEKLKNGQVFISGRYNFSQNRTDRNERSTPDSFILNAGITMDFKFLGQKLTSRLSVNNMLNARCLNHISRYRLLNLPEQGRNIIFSLKVPITI